MLLRLALLSTTFIFVSAQVFSCTGGTVYVVAHADDDLLFQSPDINKDMQAKNCITTVFLTAGDSGIGSTFAFSRESGNEAATAVIMGVANSYTEATATFASMPVMVRTLVGAPNVQKIWFRIPDGGYPDGFGYTINKGQSLEKLYFGTLGSVSNLLGTATYTKATLMQALKEILIARAPINVRTLNYLSDYDSGDHSDHHTAARFIRDVVVSTYPSVTLSGYEGYPINNLAPNVFGPDLAAKSNAFFAYTPFDTDECQSMDACQSAGRPEASWLNRQYKIDSTNLTTSTVAVLASNIAGFDLATISIATSPNPYSPRQGPSSAIDGVIDGYPGNAFKEWVASGGGPGSSLVLNWAKPYSFNKVVLWGRAVGGADQITSGTLTFNDAKSTIIAVGIMPISGPLPFSFPSLSASQLTFTINSISASTTNPGLQEIQVFGNGTVDPLAILAALTTTAPVQIVPQAGAVGTSAGYNVTTLASNYTSALNVTTLLNLTSNSLSLPSVYNYVNTSTVLASNSNLNSSSPLNVTSVANSTQALNVSTVANSTSLNATVSMDNSTLPLNSTLPNFNGTVNGTATLASSLPMITSNASSSSRGFNISASTSVSNVSTTIISTLSIAPNGTATLASSLPLMTSNLSSSSLGFNISGSTSVSNVSTGIISTLSIAPNGTATLASSLPLMTSNVSSTSIGFNVSGSTAVSNVSTGIISTLSIAPNGTATLASSLALITSNATVISLISSTSILASSTLSAIISTGTSYPSPVIAYAPPLATFANNLAQFAIATASSFQLGSEASKVNDQLLTGYPADLSKPSMEWITNGEGANATITLTWPSPIVVDRVITFDRPNPNDGIKGGLLIFSDGSTVIVGAMSNNGSGKLTSFTSRTTSFITFKITSVSPSTNNIGLNEIIVYGPPASTAIVSSASISTLSTVVAVSSTPVSSLSSSGFTTSVSSISKVAPSSTVAAITSSGTSYPSPVVSVTPAGYYVANNIALQAVATASSFTVGYEASKANDGLLASYPADLSKPSMEWVSNGEGINAFLTLTWYYPQYVYYVVTYDRPNPNDEIKAGLLTFSDGSTVVIGAMANDGSPKVTYLPYPRWTKFITFTVTNVSATTNNIGLNGFSVSGSLY